MRILLQLSILPLAALLAGFREAPIPSPAGSADPAPALLEVLPLPFLDCNENGIEDAVDIAFGTSCDADQNGIPDECERGRPAGLQAL